MMKKQSVALAILLLLTGCFQIDNAITLKNDLSGTADFHLGIDMEPMVLIMAQVGREMQGKKGPVPPEELAKAKADFKASAKKNAAKKETPTEKPKKEDVEKGLPPGVKLLSFDAKEADFGVDTYFKFGFDKLNQLIGVKLPSSKSEDPRRRASSTRRSRGWSSSRRATPSPSARSRRTRPRRCRRKRPAVVVLRLRRPPRR